MWASSLIYSFLLGQLRQFQLHLHQAPAANYVSQRLDATANTQSQTMGSILLTLH